ncbi:MAG: cystathionine gamma-synthase family protein [Cyclobacteriaceae bacterium]|nr:cystathionine gamma-synthase family protein [Cyclobacteriaceae bacterium]
MDYPKHFKPESLMMSYGYKSSLSEGAIKTPIFQTSTFAFESAEAGKKFFEVAYGLREKDPNEELGLIYSRLNNPDLEILEDRLTLWDKAEEAAVFESGMSAITTVLMEFLKPGQFVLYSSPVYGGTDHFINHVLPKYGVSGIAFKATATKEEIRKQVEDAGAVGKVGLIYTETPANPTIALVDIAMCRVLADELSVGDEKVYVAVDNTLMGPLWSHPLDHGADMVVYSATKYIGGHSDVIAGACLGSKEVIGRIKTLRTFFGNMAGPWTGWLLMRSLETLKVRMEKQATNATQVAEFLASNTKVEKVHYLGMIEEADPQYAIYKRQYESPGAMLSFEIKGGEKEAFKFLNSLKLIKLAVSLGSTESLAEHPKTMTHIDVSPDDQKTFGITDNLVRISVGVENPEDLIWDIKQALEQV